MNAVQFYIIFILKCNFLFVTAMTKNNIQDILIKKGRELIWEKGTENLTARKLSEFSGYSVGTIYNQFGSMEGFILLQNYITLDELFIFMKKTKFSSNPYILINAYADAFVTFVLNNNNFWDLLFNFHIKNGSKTLSRLYLRKISEILKLIDAPFGELYPFLEKKEKTVLLNTLWQTLFSLSSFLLSGDCSTEATARKKTTCKITLNAFLSGTLILPKD